MQDARLNPSPLWRSWLLPLLLILTGLQLPAAEASPLPGTSGAAMRPAPVAEETGLLVPEQIREYARMFLEERVAAWPAEETRYEVQVDPPDPRLQLADCGAALSLSAPPQGIAPGRVAVKMSCVGEYPWNIYVTGRIRALREVVVSARPMGRGEIITPADLMVTEQELDELRRGYFTDPEELVGMVVKRPVGINRVIETRAIALPRLIRRGEAVQIVAENETVRVQMEGVALSDGALGERIQVRNRRSGRVVSAVVHGSGEVQVPL